jgi:hypothetical protein
MAKLKYLLLTLVLVTGCTCPVWPPPPPEPPPWEPPMGAPDWAASANGGVAEVTAGSVTDVANSNDSNDDTYAVTSAPSVPVIGEITNTFAHAVTVVQFQVRCLKTGGGPTGTILAEYYDGSWHTLEEFAAPTVVTTKSWSYPDGISNVTKMRVSYIASVPTAKRIYTMSAYGNYYQDKGLRIWDGSEARVIAVESLTENPDNPLRVRIGATTWGVPMVATDHARAGPVRVYDGADVQALVDITP